MEKIDKQIADLVNEIMRYTEIDMWNRRIFEEYYTKKIKEIYSRCYYDGANAKQCGKD